ncbi:MAG: hypothetical protein GY792_05835 [Gammaproteobacteria bacterium]|nr:hypothetical protein [Gammaproteobacteria bacterium]
MCIQTSFIKKALVSTIGMLLVCSVSAKDLAESEFDADQDEQFSAVMEEISYVDADYPESEYEKGYEPKALLAPSEIVVPVRDDQSSANIEYRAQNSGASVSDTYHSGIISTTKIIITTSSHVNAGTASTFRFYIGNHYRTLTGASTPNRIYTWDYSDSDSNWWRNIHPDNWDHIRLQANSGDGMKIAHIKIMHNNYTILDTDVNAWLDKYHARKLVFDNEIAMTKWSMLDNTRNPVLYYAVMDIGKSGHQKYMNADEAWCSEFASWAIRQGTGRSTPAGPIWVQDMKDYFDDRGRLYSKSDIEAGTYNLKGGDYVSINDRGHSVIFVEWTSYLNTFRVIDGNWGNRVRIRTVNWSDVGNSDGIGSI